MIIYSNKLFENPVEVIKAFDSQEFLICFKKIESLREKYFLVGYIRYEAKDIFLGKSVKSELPLLYFEVFDGFKEYQPKKGVYAKLNTAPDITFNEYKNALTQIKEEIADGNTYEVNYTYDWDVDYSGSELKLYEYLLHKQTTPYNAFFKNEYDTVLSFSPELFFELEGSHILTKPMKGTMPRGET